MIWAFGFYWRIREPMVRLIGWRGYLKAIWRSERGLHGVECSDYRITREDA